jgi:hypothetical protein
MAVQIVKAKKQQSRLRMALDGPAGSGKTYTALRFAFALATSYDKVLVVDTEHASAAKYVGEDPDGLGPWPEFDAVILDNFNPQNYIDAIEAGEKGGYEVIVIDSLSHAWEGAGGVLEMHDQATKRSGSGNSFTAWRDVTPVHRRLVEAMLQSRCHIIATMRSKMDYIQTTDDKGRTVIKKVGMAPVQRQGIEYEFDVVGDLDADHNLVVSKSRCARIADAVVNKPGAKWFQTVKAWLNDGSPVPPAPTPQPKAPAPKAEPARSQISATQPAAKPNGEGQTNNSGNWTRQAQEREAFKRFLSDHGVTDDEAKAIAGDALGLPGPIKLFSEWPHSRERLQHVILAWLLANRPATGAHWMDDEKERKRFWASVGEQGYDEAKVHEIIPSLHQWQGSVDEAIDFVVNAKHEERGQMPLPEAAGEAQPW